jgi:hypothetical protein
VKALKPLSGATLHSNLLPSQLHGTRTARWRPRVHENLIQYLRQRQEAFPFRRDIDLRHFLTDAVGAAASLFPVPAKIFLLDELEPKGYGFPITRSATFDDLETRFERWLDEELSVRGRETERTRELLAGYREQVVRLAQNAADSSVLADYYSVFWLLHTQQLARRFTAFVRKAITSGITRDEAERLKFSLHGKWTVAIRQTVDVRGFVQLMLENALIAAEEFVSPDLRELRGYVQGYLRRDFAEFMKSFEELRKSATDLLSRDRILRRAVTLLGYPETSGTPHVVALLDPRVWQLLGEHPLFKAPSELSLLDTTARRLLEFFVVHNLRRGVLWMKNTPEGENIADDDSTKAPTVYSRAIRPMNFGRRGVVEPTVYRYGLVYDITSFTETLGELVRGGKDEEQHSYRQMLDFQRELADITKRHGMQFEKFLGDGAFYTSRRATRSLQAGIEIQRFYATARANGFAFNKGMRIALNYGYYRLLPMQVSADGTQIMEFYGPGIVELSRLTTGKATKELEDIQHLLLAHGYDQNDVYRFFAPLSRGVQHIDTAQQQREFYAFVNEAGHLINEGIVVSIPFLKQLSTELIEDSQKMYRLRAPWNVYLGFPAIGAHGGYIGMRILGSVALKGIGQQDIAEVVWLSSTEADISLLDDPKPLLQLLHQERHRQAARSADSGSYDDVEIGRVDLVVCEAVVQTGENPMILVGEWDPISEEVRRPIRLDGVAAERYGLAIPLTAQAVESQSIAYQKLYRTLSRIETLPSFSVGAIRANTNFNGFIIGATVEPL